MLELESEVLLGSGGLPCWHLGSMRSIASLWLMMLVVINCPNAYTVMPKKPNRNWELQRLATAGQWIYA